MTRLPVTRVLLISTVVSGRRQQQAQALGQRMIRAEISTLNIGHLPASKPQGSRTTALSGRLTRERPQKQEKPPVAWPVRCSSLFGSLSDDHAHLEDQR
jgi:hypothetical protein